MSKLREALEKYIAVRRSLGFKLRNVEYVLRNFVTFVERKGAMHITTDLALRWTKQMPAVQLDTCGSRLQMVRRFAIWCSATDVHTEVWPKDLIPFRYRRKTPYIYSDEEIEKLIQAASKLPLCFGLKGLTYSILFGLLSVTGMRVSEAVGLDREDVDLEEGVLTIRLTKFGKSRLLPLHDSTRQVLAHYGEERDRVFPRQVTHAFFLSEHGTRVSVWAVQYNFAKVSREVGLRAPVQGHRRGHGPRLHDLRH